MIPAVEGRNHHDRTRHESQASQKRTKERKGSRTPKGASLSSALARCGARPAGRARLPAFHCGSRQGDCSSPRLSLSQASCDSAGACEPMDRQPGRVSHASPRALPAPACPSPVSTSRAGHSAGRLMPKPPEERAVSSRPRAPHSLRFPGVPSRKASLGERDSPLVT